MSFLGSVFRTARTGMNRSNRTSPRFRSRSRGGGMFRSLGTRRSPVSSMRGGRIF